MKERMIPAMIVLVPIFSLSSQAQMTPLGSEFQVTSSVAFSPSLAMDGQGDFIVVWNTAGPGDGRLMPFSVQRFDSMGNPLGTELQFTPSTTSSESQPSVGMDDGGNFVVVWKSQSIETLDSLGIFGQRFSVSGQSSKTVPALPWLDR